MKFGLAIFPTDRTVPPGELGPMVEERGFDSLLFPEHTHIPTSRATPYPAGGDLPSDYWHTMDPFVASTAAAASTRNLLVGTGICLLAQRDPITTAKEVASVDYVSGGRFLFGVGAGWTVEEMANHGTDASTRFGLLQDRVEAMRAIWTQDAAEYHGRYVDFDPLWSWPKPAQRPHPPILLGGDGPRVFDRVLAFADEWLPNFFGNPQRMARRVSELRRRGREEQDRDIAVTVQVAPTEPAELAVLEEAGVHRCAWYLPPRDRDRVERALDRYVAVVRAYRGER
jgi:probable F420-dependent oxidoreductase